MELGSQQLIIVPNIDQIDLTIFEKQEKLSFMYMNKYNFYKIINIRNGTKYIAKVYKFTYDEFGREEFLSFYREVDINSRLNHPAILNILGYSMTNFKNKNKPVIINEDISNNAEYNHFLEKDSFHNRGITDTKKLIAIYGIASGMSYLHSHNIIHRNLKAKNIFFNDLFYPKISGFDSCISLPKGHNENESIKGMRLYGSPRYLAPEILSDLEYSKSSDVYAFSMIMYYIVTDKKPFKGIKDEKNFFKIVYKNNEHPKFEEPVNDAYRKLIERCWSYDPKMRPSFNEIVAELKTNPEFITEKINEEEFQKYIKFIEDSSISFDSRKKERYLDNFLNCIKLNSTRPISNNSNNYLPNACFDLCKYKIKRLLREKNEYKIFSIINKDNEQDKYEAQFYFKEFNSFYRNEIINLYHKLNIISQINHPAILKFVGYSHIDFNQKLKPVIIEEYFRDDLTCLGLQFTKILISLYGIASAMAYLHSYNIIHRDLKPKNVLLDYRDLPKITGFDISIQMNDKDIYKTDKIKGTPAYLAPEVYLYNEYSKSSDVYSFSLIMYELLTGYKPYEKLISPKQIKKLIAEEGERPLFDKPINKAYRQLIERCWSQDPKLRPTFEEIVHELQTNPEFITDEIDEEEYFTYVEYVNKYSVSFDSTKRFNQFDDIISTRIHTFNENKMTNDFNDTYETETNNISFENSYIYFLSYNIYEKLDKINGSFYSVYLLKNKETNERIIVKAAKYINKLTMSEANNFSNELTILPKLNHPSILKFIGYNPKEPNEKKLSIIMEYSPKGSLLQYIDENLNETNKLIIIYGISSAMQYLHKHNILHCDLKTSNIYLDEFFYPKISGFNLAKDLKNKTKIKDQKIKGTPAYLAPEVYLYNEYSKSSDVYSFSLIMYELLTGYNPYDMSISPKQIKKLIAEGERPLFDKPINKAYRQLIERCWSQDPKLRPTFEEIVHELQTNPEFITDEIDEEQFFKYIKMISEYNDTFDSTKRISHMENIIKSQKINFHENNDIINIKNIYETEFNEILFNYDFANIEDFEKQELIYDSLDYKKYKVIHKKSKMIYLAIKYIFPDYVYGSNYNAKLQRQKFNNFISLNHPVLLNFIGYSPIDFKFRPSSVYLKEYASNKSLEQILEIDINNKSKKLLNDTKRLIIIYGIASGMSYLHSHNYIHSNLRPSTVFVDDFLFPKIKGFNHFLDSAINPIPELSESNPKYHHYKIDIYISPEIHTYNINSTAADVYSFAMIAYQLITNNVVFPNITEEIINKICNENLRPKLNESVPDCYKKLFEKCWSNDPKERPTFDEITYHLRTNKEFINENINKDEYQNYINLIEKSISSHNNYEYDDFIKSQNKLFRKVQINIQKIRESKINFKVDVGSIDIHDFDMQEKIGSGGFGVIYKIQEKETNNLYAAKISKFNIEYCDEDIIINLSREINIISQLEHPSILKYIGFSPCNLKNKPKPVIITEYASNRSLDKIIELEHFGCAKNGWNDTKKLINIYGIASGMAYLHNKNIIHRDLKPSNILLDDYLFPKIADFGMSKILYEEDIALNKKKKLATSGFKGTYAYCAPEVISSQIYSKEGDVYSFGMIVYEIVTSEVPYEGLNQFQLWDQLNNKCRPKFKYRIPYGYRKLIENCWQDDVYRRPSFDKIVKILEKDISFITSTVDKEEYLDYISYIKEQENLVDYSQIHPNILQYQTKFHTVTFDNKKVDEIEPQLSHEYFLDLSNYSKQDLISENYFSKLYKLEEKQTGNIFFGQMLMFSVDQIKNDEQKKFLDDLKKIKELKHPSLLKFIGYSPLNFKKQKYPVILTEYASNGTLEYILKEERNNKKIPYWDETKKLIVIFGIAFGMAYLHSHDIIHKSLRPSNIYLDEILSPKLGDFGLSTRFLSLDSITHQSISGIRASPIYSSPEVLLSNEYSKSSDVYSFSLIVYEIMNNKLPFENDKNMNLILNEVVNKGIRPKINEDLPESYHNLIKNCWLQDPKERLTFNEIVELLKHDQGFITEKINKDGYQQYINIVESQIESQKNKKINETEDIQNDFSILKEHQLKDTNKLKIEALAKKYSIENDSENIYKYFCMLIKSGNYMIPLEYATRLYKKKYHIEAYNYFSLISKTNNPIALYFIAVMMFYGHGCNMNREKSFEILKQLSKNGIERANEFLEDHFNV